MYEKCIKCERLGKDCIPNLYIMDVLDIREWTRKLKEEKGWTNAHLAEVSGIPKGTIDSCFSKKNGKNADVNYSTFSAILCALLECDHIEMLCRDSEAECCHIFNENEELRKENAELKERYASIREDYENRIAYFKENIKYKRHIIAILIIISCILCTFILLGIAVDWNYSDIGFFWR